MPISRVDDASDERLVPYLHLTNHQLRSAVEGAGSFMVVESLIAIDVALSEGVRPRSFFVEEGHLDRLSEELERHGVGDDVDVLVGSKAFMSDVCGFKVTRGYLSVMDRPRPRSVGEVIQGARRIAVLEDLVDSSNVGAIIRSAAALNVDGIIFSPRCADPLNRRTIRTSMGTVFQVPWARAGEPWPAGAFDELERAGFMRVAMALTDDALPIDDPALAGVEKMALVFGTEGTGLRPQTLAACDHAAIIPMSHDVDSLNVAASSAVAFWQLCR